MFGYDEIGISLSFHPIFLILALILITGYTYFTYKYTIPPTGRFRKIVLITLRAAAILLLVVLLFEPALNLVSKKIVTPFNLVFIDNSRSMTIDDRTHRTEKTKKIAEELAAISKAKNFKFYLFGSDVKEIAADSVSRTRFTEGITDISAVFNSIKKDEIIFSSLTLITDGIFNSGNDPYYGAINAGVPVFSVGIGDTVTRKDVEIKKVLYNDLIYVEIPTTIAGTIRNYDLPDKEVTVSLFEQDELVSSQIIKLSRAGIQNVNFDYTPGTSGEKKLSVVISGLDEEFSTANNKKIFYVNVLSNKIKILLLASSPSPDLTFIKNSLLRDENLTINTITQVAPDRFLENTGESQLDSADILFLIGFPSGNTPEKLWRRILDKIMIDKVPYFLLLSPIIDFNRLQNLKAELSFSVDQILHGYRLIQPVIPQKEISHPLLSYSSSKTAEAWNNLPPVLQQNSVFTPKPESRVLSNIKINNRPVISPLLLIRNFSGRKSITVLAYDIWRWKLQTATKRLELFDSFIINSVRWLNALEDQQRVKIKTTKKNYSQGERIELSANVFDESLNPVSDAQVKVKIASDNNTYEIDLESLGAGIYEGSISINETGDLRYSGEAVRDGIGLGSDEGKFNIGETDLEMINPVMNYNLLTLISKETGGDFYTPDNYADLLDRIDEINKSSGKEKIIASEIKLWSDEWLLVIAILLFSLEWFIRKRKGLL